MIKYTIDFGDQYFVEHFRNSYKYQLRTLIGPYSQPERNKRISVCTTCMNRLHDISLTLPKNIDDNQDYPDAEFVLLDYGSSDGLEDWVRSEMCHHIESGRLVYYQSPEQQYFRHNHSRNLSFRLAGGEIITNVDSDNYIHPGFLARINQCASVSDSRLIIVPDSFMLMGSDRLVLRGRFAIHTSDLMAMGGFDEDLDGGYSHDDTCFVVRAMLCGYKTVRFEDHFLNDRIETSVEDSIKHTKLKDFRAMQDRNARIAAEKMARCEVLANRGKDWGEGWVIKNFAETIRVPASASSILC